MHPDIAIIILAAGGSSRLGKPKQLLPYQGSTLIGSAMNAAKTMGCVDISVITGAAHEQIFVQIEAENVNIIQNNDWQSGMASSIRSGINHVQRVTGVKAALIMLCDQPLITNKHLDELIAEFAKDNDKIIATAYGDVIGVPAIFPKGLFEELQQLTGDQGARQLISRHQQGVISVLFEGAALDIDTEEDYQKLTGL